jgi:hypothetical protein
MNKRFYGLYGFIVASGLLITGLTGIAQAEVNVNINFGPPPVFASEPPEVVMMPGSGIYFVPGMSFDVFFYNGYWWSPRGDRWYRTSHYNGSWEPVERRYVPDHLVRVPKNYREVYKKERPVNYGQWKKQIQNRQNNGHKKK